MGGEWTLSAPDLGRICGMQSRLYLLAGSVCLALLTAAVCSGTTFEAFPPDLVIRPNSDVIQVIGGAGDPPEVVAPHERAPLSADAGELLAGNNQFALDLYRRLSAGQPAAANTFASPFSVSSALG